MGRTVYLDWQGNEVDPTNLDNSMEEIAIDGEEEIIFKERATNTRIAPFPAVSVSKNNRDDYCLVFNQRARVFFKGYTGIRFSLSPNYLIMTPCKYINGRADLYRLRDECRINVPTEVSSRGGVEEGLYKLYKNKNRYVIKRYERVETDDQGRAIVC